MKEAYIRHIPHNPRLRGLACRVPDVVFSTASGTPLTMQILTPWREEGDERRYPLIVFLQGSAWTSPDVNYELPQLAGYARAGYVVASITHRSRLDGHPAPAFLQDAKTAVRFLRANAKEFGVDPERVCFFGTSSGGNTSMLIALTGDDERYRTSEYAAYSDAVQLSVECFGPSDLGPLMAARGKENLEALTTFLGGDPAAHADLLRQMSPLCILPEVKNVPPMLLLHGDADEMVPYEQGTQMYEALLAAGHDAEMICINGAPHEGSFWSEAVHEAVLDFLARRL